MASQIIGEQVLSRAKTSFDLDVVDARFSNGVERIERATRVASHEARIRQRALVFRCHCIAAPLIVRGLGLSRSDRN
jgi:hypothetical protein